MDYRNKWFVVTGAYRGIGKSIATYFARGGANIILTYHHNRDKTEALKDELISKYHVNALCLPLELKDESSIENLYNYINSKKIDLFALINNAALSMDNYYLDKAKEEFMEVLEVNAVGTFLMMKYFEKYYKNRYIINISSTDGIDTGSIYSVDYNASKACINTISKTLMIDSSNYIICICPNWVLTEAVKEMNQDYLKSELQRVHQDKLINPETIAKVIDREIQKKKSEIIRIDGDLDV